MARDRKEKVESERDREKTHKRISAFTLYNFKKSKYQCAHIGMRTRPPLAAWRGRLLAACLLALLCVLFFPGRPRASRSGRALNLAPRPAPQRASPPGHPSLVSEPLLQGRRNHGCAFLGDTMVLAAGRHAPSIELWNTVTGRHELAVPYHPLLDINHHQLLVVDKVGLTVGADGAAAARHLKRPFPPTGKEIWIPCGFIGSDVDQERTAEHTVIIDPDQGFSVRRGPRIDRPRGACGALALDLDGPGTPQHICLFGGSVGSHDRGTFTTLVTCYDRVRQQWHQPLAQLPVPADHVNAVRIPAGVKCGEGVEGAAARPEQLLYLNFRDRSYGAQRSEVFALDLERDEAGRVVEQGAADKGWYELGRTDAGHTNGDEVLPIPPRDAAGIEVSPTGRFVFTFGGVNYVHPEMSSRTATIFQDVVAFDVCTGKSVALPASTTMKDKRFAVETCKNGDNRAFTCGGTANGPDSLNSCDVHDLEALEGMALKASSGVSVDGVLVSGMEEE